MAFSTITRRTLMALGASALIALASNLPAKAQEFPDRTITLVVPFAAGGSTDVVARIIAQKMSEGLGQQIIVENVGGAGGSLGADRVARSEPDGYTILMATVATHALNPLILTAKPYDPEKDFAPVSLLVVVPNVLVVNPELPAKTVPELIALLRSASSPARHGLPHERIAFAHNSERELARLFDFYGLRWEYEPHTFVLERGADGSPTRAFAPDFYLPDHDRYLEVTTLDQRPPLARLR